MEVVKHIKRKMARVSNRMGLGKSDVHTIKSFVRFDSNIFLSGEIVLGPAKLIAPFT